VNALNGIFVNHDLSQAMGDKGFAKVCQKYAVESVYKQHITIFKRIINKSAVV
jgi:hypothetical protein